MERGVRLATSARRVAAFAFRIPGNAHDLRLIALCFTAGLLAVHQLSQLPAWQWLALIAVPAFVPWRWRGLYAAFVLGVLWTVWRAAPVLEQRWPLSRHGEDLDVPGHVISLPEPGAFEGGDVWRFQFQPDREFLAAHEHFPERIRVSWYRAEQAPRGGDCWRFTLRLRTPHGSLNPGGFDYEAWLFRQGIAATATVREGQRCEGHGAGSFLRMRQALLDRYRAWLPGHPGLPLAAALTLGDDSQFRDADWDAFRLTGTSHLVAISGFNIAIAAALAFFLGRWSWSLWPRLCLWLPAQRVGLIASAIAGLLYALLAGWEPPVQRAALMLLILLAAAWMGRLQQPSRVLAVAWLAMLLLDPFALLSPGLWLSFAAVGAIFYVSAHRLKPSAPWREALRLQLMLSLALVPMTLFFFQGAAWLSPLVNLVAVPVVAVLTPILLIAVALCLVSPSLGIHVFGVTVSALERCHTGLLWLADAVQGSGFYASPPLLALLLAGFGMALLFAPRGLPVRPLALMCFLPMLWPPQSAPQQGFTLAVLDVGQGLSVVVNTAHHRLVYDAGPAFEDGFDAGASVVAPYLLQQGSRRVDLFLLSHSDQDHAGGLPALRSRVKLLTELGSDQGPPCRDGQGWYWDGVHFQLLHPDDAEWSDNEGSCVLRISDGTHSALLSGDIQKKAEARLLRLHADELRADLLVAPHHGSKTSSGEDFVAAVRPQIGVFGAGWRNRYGHPRAEVLERYRAIGAQTWSAGASGALEITPQPASGWQIKEWRLEGRHFWNAEAGL